MCNVHKIEICDILKCFNKFSEVNFDFDTCALESQVLEPGFPKIEDKHMSWKYH